MDKKTYDRTTESEFKGRKVISRVPLRNGYISLPAGTTFIIEHKQGGFELRSDPCPHCGIRVWVSKVPPGDVDFIDTEACGRPVTSAGKVGSR